MIIEHASQGIAQEVFAERLDETIRFGHQRLAEVSRPGDGRAIRQLTGGINRRQGVGIICTELTDGTEILERQPERIHHAVTGEAGGIRAVLFEARPQRLGRLAAFVLRE